jgi:hypothetical protein
MAGADTAHCQSARGGRVNHLNPQSLGTCAEQLVRHPSVVKHKRNWLIILLDSQGEVYGPIWEVESKIKPTLAAKRSVKNLQAVSYKIKEVVEFSEVGYLDSFVKAVEE